MLCCLTQSLSFIIKTIFPVTKFPLWRKDGHHETTLSSTIVFNSTQLKLTILVRCIYVKTIPRAYWVVYLILTMILFEDITKNACLNSSFHLKISGLVFACESYLSCIYNLSPLCLAAGQTNREKKLQVERQEDKIIPYCIPHDHHTNDIGIKIQIW